MSVKLVVGILLLVSIMLAGTGTAEASKVVLMDAKDTGTAQAYAFDIDDIDSPNIQSSAIGIIIMEKLRDISDED